MELLEELKAVGKGTEFAESKNYYYENHLCEEKGGNEKVNLDFCLSSEMTDRILKFGKCPHCGIYFYHYDYDSKSI